jgi:anti-repressor protein
MRKTDKIVDDNASTMHDWQSMSKAAKLVGMGRNKLFAFLKSEGILKHHNETEEIYCDEGYFKMEQVDKYMKRHGFYRTFPLLLVSRAGIIFIKELIERRRAHPEKNKSLF